MTRRAEREAPCSGNLQALFGALVADYQAGQAHLLNSTASGDDLAAVSTRVWGELP